VKTRILFKIGHKSVQLGEMAEAEAIFPVQIRFSWRWYPLGKTIGTLLVYTDFYVKRKENSTTM